MKIIENQDKQAESLLFREFRRPLSDLDAYGDPYSNAEAQAFRRSCARWGLGLHLWG